jgi:hypothetical protein
MSDLEFPDSLERWTLRLPLVLPMCIANGSVVLYVLRYLWREKTRSMSVTRKASAEIEDMSASFGGAGSGARKGVRGIQGGGYAGCGGYVCCCLI